MSARKRSSEEVASQNDRSVRRRLENDHGNGFGSNHPIDSTTNQINSQHTEYFLSKDDLPPFRPGAIMRIALYNFMTYDNVEIMPGPGLNLVLGPNGTGKSSIVSAICVGLAGNPKLLGRASKVRDYVKHGKEKAYIEIDLCGRNNKVITIKRIFKAKSNTSTWKINGKPAKNNEVEDLISSYNIQLDNLTQFLPQDKVASFAAMGPVELLQSTQKAVLKPEIIAKQQELIEAQKRFIQYSSSVGNLKQQIAQLRKQNESIEKDIQRFKERQEHLDRAERLKIRELFIRFTTKQADGRALMNEKKSFEQKQRDIDDLLVPAEEKKEAIREKLTSLKREEDIVTAKVMKKKEEINSLNHKLETLSNGYNQAKNAIDRLSEREAERQKTREKYNSLIEKQKERLQEISDLSEKEVEDATLKAKEERYMTTRKDLEEKRNELVSKNRELNATLKLINHKLQQLQQHDQMILTSVKEQNHQAFEIYQWIVKNKDKFESPNEVFFVPLVVNIKNPLHAIYFESTVSKNYQFGFVTTSIRDRDLIQNQIKDRNFQLTVLRVSNVTSRKEQRYTKEELARFGLSDYLDHVISAPTEVMNALCDVSSIHYVLFSEKSNLKIEEIGKYLTQARTVFEPQLRHFIAPSKYSSDLSIRSDPLNRQPRLFKSIDKTSYDQLKSEKDQIASTLNSLMESIKKLDAENHSIDISLEEVRSQRREIKKHLNEKEKITRSIERYEKEVKRLSREENLDDVRRKHQDEMKVYNQKRVQVLKRLKDELSALFDIDFSTDIFPILKSKLRDEDIAVTQSQSSLIEEKNLIIKSYKKVAQELDALTSELKQLKVDALEKKKEYMEKHNLDDDEMRNILNELPNDLEEIREYIAIEEAAANTIMDNQNVVREYEKRKKDIDRLENQLNDIMRENSTMEDIIKNIETEWVTPLKECIRKLNDTFQIYTRGFGIAGEVALNPHPSDYSKWEIQIKVKFRDNEPMAVLSKNRQSGGERSVTTILYLLSLQVINKSPFRVVDEINQGMDPINERKIFLQMLKSCQGRDVPQSFLVTPKLLPDLVPRDANNITILFIFNGPFGLSSKEWLRHAKSRGLIEYSGGKSLEAHSDDEEDDLD